MSDAAIATIVTGVVTVATMICGVLTLWIKLKESNKKIDQNTALTRAGTNAAANNAAIAAKTATDARNAAEAMATQLEKRLNGDLENLIASMLAPINDRMSQLDNTLKDHAVSDARSIGEINRTLESLISYTHNRNHDILNGMQTLSSQMIILLDKMKKEGK